jgi:two-component system response regulator AtoC
MPGMDGLSFLNQAKIHHIDATIIMMSAYATVDTAVQAMKMGAYDVITKPFRMGEVLCVFDKALERLRLQRENLQLKEKIAAIEGPTSFNALVGKSKNLRDVIAVAAKAAESQVTVLITGESGTGKELIARGIHHQSSRRDKPFVAVNCAAIPENLLESEFFGHRKGAFTGADRNKKGLFEEAEGGTLLLDEVGELPLALQVKLLRVLQQREVMPVGATVPHSFNVRILAATARDLQLEAAEGRFRQDLFYRLNVVTLVIPPLRQRKDDILELCNHFIRHLCQAQRWH